MDRDALIAVVEDFDPTVPIERAHTPPASWYLEPGLLELERDTVFSDNWIAVGRVAQVAQPGEYLAGSSLKRPWVVVRHTDGSLRAFHNACRHHAAVVLEGSGCVEALTCPYHGWTYSLDGSLKAAPRMAGVENFDRETMGLRPLAVDTWNDYVFVHFGEPRPLLNDLALLDERMAAAGPARLHHAITRSYTVRCNWKVFVDNYLDGGYHVSRVHADLASSLDLDSYGTVLYDRFSVQGCGAKGGRLGGAAIYAWAHPNLMLNRYGPVLDVNRVVPISVDETLVVFDFFFEERLDDRERFIEACIESSEKVQQEDIAVSERVQAGLHSPGYDRGRYAPGIEHGEHHFHRLLAGELRAGLAPADGGRRRLGFRRAGRSEARRG